jgi:hypothetical protein
MMDLAFNESALDVGCETGTLTSMLANKVNSPRRAINKGGDTCRLKLRMIQAREENKWQ